MATTWGYGGFCACGCGQKTKLSDRNHGPLGWKKGEPFEYISQHQNKKKRQTYVVDPVTGCHVWQGQPSQRYPSLKIKGKPRYVHQWAWEQEHGPVPTGMVLHHRCENRRCCNVEHLEIVTAAHNVHLGAGAKLTMEKADRIRRLAESGGYTHAKLGELYGVSKTTIQNVVYGHTWRPKELHRPQRPARRQDD